MIVDLPASTTSPISRVCLRPYRYTGAADIKRGYSGSSTQFHFTGARYLRVDSVKAWLDTVPISAADLGGWTDGMFSWTEMPLVDGVPTYSARHQGRLYLDSNAFGSVVLYYWGGAAGYAGRIEVTGCLVDAIPPPAIRVPVLRDVPRLPPRRLDPGDAVMEQLRRGGG